MTDRVALKYGSRLGALPALLAAGAARAELPSGVSTAITAAGADLVTAATAVIVAMIAFWALRKVGQKMGWW
ncbi:major capsid protein [Ottowia testudinis]|uniref:major capsid protein n=1 Tax=Ottowia testudinis TaxID=2816950 RepID=UPI003D647D8A